MSSTLSRPPHLESNIHRVAILFAGGPAPAANAVISTAAVSFLRNNIEVYGILHGYSHLVEYAPDHSMAEGRDYIRITHNVLKRTRNSQGIIIGTARTNPGKDVSEPAHLKDPKRTAPLKTVYDALVSLGVDALISIGGDDTLKTANKFKLYQEHLPPRPQAHPGVHLPKTIDNDYSGIDFTFGYFTAVEVLAGEIRNLLADAESNRSYFIAETMGRSAGWLAYGAAIAGEASLVISVEDITGKYEASEEIADLQTGKTTIRRVMDLDEVVKRIVATMRVREEAEGKEFGVVVIAEGLAEYLPQTHIEGVPRDEHGHIAVAKLNLSRLFADLVGKEYTEQTGKKRKTHRRATRLRVPLRPPAGLRRDARQPTRRGRLSSTGGKAARRRDGLRLRTVEPELRALPPVGRSGHAGDGRALHRTRQRLPPPGAVPGNVRARVTAAFQGHEATDVCPRRAGQLRVGEKANQFDHVVDLHFFQHGCPVLGHGFFADAQFSGDLFAAFSRHQQIEHLALLRRKFFHLPGQFGLVAGLALSANVTIDRLANAGRQGLKIDRLLQKIQCPGTHGFDRRGDVAAAGHHNRRHAPSLGREHLLQAQAAKSRHADVEHHALRRFRAIAVTVEEGLRRRVGLHVQSHAANHQRE